VAQVLRPSRYSEINRITSAISWSYLVLDKAGKGAAGRIVSMKHVGAHAPRKTRAAVCGYAARLYSLVHSIDAYRIPSPCSVAWEEMTPLQTDPARHCSQCSRAVYDFEQMSRAEIEALLASQSYVCAHMPRHPDGALVTREAPWSVPRRRLHVLTTITASAAALAGLAGCTEDRIGKVAPMGSAVPGTTTTANGEATATAAPAATVTAASASTAPPTVSVPPHQTSRPRNIMVGKVLVPR
jgi:hypothetical protein